MKQKYLSLGSILAILTGCNTTVEKSEDKSIETNRSKHPNVVIFHVDDLGWTDAGCFGSDYYETPNIDKLCGQGMKFTNAYAPGAISSPSRASVQTGKYTSRLGITDWIRASFQKDSTIDYSNPPEYEENEGKKLKTPFNQNFLPLKEKTIAEYLKEEGYITAHIGKWHLGEKGHYPTDQGYDMNIAGCDYGEPPSYFDPYHREAHTYPWGYEPAFSIPTLKPRKKGEYLTNRLADEACKIIRQNKDTALFLFHNFYGVHTPIQAIDSLIQKYERKDTTRHNNPVYAAMIESVDEAVGQVINLMDSLALSENTIFIFTSDNGGLLRVTDNFPLRNGKGTAFEGGIRVPFIMKWDNHIKSNTVSDLPFTTMSILPTLADILDFQVKSDGESIAPVALGEKPGTRKSLFWHYPHYRHNNSPYTIIRSDSFKLIKFYDGDSLELYNMKNDISETTDVSEKFPNITDSLHRQINEHLSATNAKLPVSK